MYIIQPAWLSKVGIIPQGAEVSIQSKLDEPGFRFTSRKLGKRWLVTPNRIEVQTDDPKEDCGADVSKVLKHLPWTPLVALGNNAIFKAPVKGFDTLPIATSLRAEAPEGFEIVQRTLHYALKREVTIFNVQLAVKESEIEISVNAHTELRGQDSEFAQGVAQRFPEDRAQAERLIEHLFQAKVTYAEHDANSAREIHGTDQ